MLVRNLPRRFCPIRGGVSANLDVWLRAKASRDSQLRPLLEDADQLYYSFEPRPNNDAEFDQQTAFIEDRESKFSVCLGGTGSGKTLAAAYKTARYVLEKPPMREALPFWIIGEYLDQICKVAWVEKLSKLIPKSEILDVVWWLSKRNWPRAVILRHPYHRNRPGWVLEFKSYEQGIGSMKAESIGGYWCNEEIPYHLLAEIQGRCRDYNSPGWADFTPVECKDPEWPEAYENWQAGTGPKGWNFYHLNNLLNEATPEGSETSIAEWARDYLENVPEDLRAMRTTGHFTVLKGAVYKEFRKSLHVIDPNDAAVREEYGLAARTFPFIPRDWPKWRSIDFGYNNPFCCLWFAKHDGTIFVYDEHYESQRLLSYHAMRIKQREWDDTEPWYGATYADHDAQDCAELTAMGVATTPAYKPIHHGIELVRTQMMPQAHGTPRLIIFANCKNLIREIPGYKWQVGTDTRNPQDLPYGVDDHALDALRYGVATETLKGRGGAPQGRRVVRDARRHGVLLEKRA